MSPGDIQPVLFGITLPSMFGWIGIFVGLIVLITVIQLVAWAYYADVGDRQYADPETREKMHLGMVGTPFGSRIAPAVERLAEPQRSQARRHFFILNVCLGVAVAGALLTIALYMHL